MEQEFIDLFGILYAGCISERSDHISSLTFSDGLFAASVDRLLSRCGCAKDELYAPSEDFLKNPLADPLVNLRSRPKQRMRLRRICKPGIGFHSDGVVKSVLMKSGVRAPSTVHPAIG